MNTRLSSQAPAIQCALSRTNLRWGIDDIAGHQYQIYIIREQLPRENRPGVALVLCSKVQVAYMRDFN